MEKPTLYPEGEGRWKDAGITEVASIDSRGSRGGMLWRKYRAARETRYGGGCYVRLSERTKADVTQCDWQLIMSLPSRGIIHSWLSAFEKVESSP